MAFPKKYTRKLVVNNEQYLWHLNGNWEVSNSWIVISKKDCESNQLLFLDPYHHDILPTKSTVTSAIIFGIENGWKPHEKGKNIKLAFNGRAFEVISEKHTNWEHHQDSKYLRGH